MGCNCRVKLLHYHLDLEAVNQKVKWRGGLPMLLGSVMAGTAGTRFSSYTPADTGYDIILRG